MFLVANNNFWDLKYSPKSKLSITKYKSKSQWNILASAENDKTFSIVIIY